MRELENQRPDLSDNPFLKIENPFAETEGKRQALEDAAKELQRLCYSVWHTYPDGQRLWEKLLQMYIMNNQVDPTTQSAGTMAIWWDGFRSALLGMYNMGTLHLKRTNGVTE